MIEVKPLTDTEIKSEIVRIISGKLPETDIILFGSRATGNHHERSDYDIAVKGETRIPADIFFEIKDELVHLDTLKIIDISDYWDMDEFFQKTVDNEGIILYNGKN